MELALLPPIILAIAEQRSLDAVLSSIATAVASQPDVGLARVWLRDTDRTCPVCARHAPTNDEEALHLRASAGRPLDRFERLVADRRDVSPHPAFGSAEDRAHRQDRRADSDRSSRSDGRWVQFPGWAQAGALRGFAGRPLVFRGETLGVLGVFRRIDLDDRCWEWLRTLSDAAAVAVKNARALEEAESLRRALELERDYLREEVREGGSFGEILGRSPALQRVCGTSTPLRPPTPAC